MATDTNSSFSLSSQSPTPSPSPPQSPTHGSSPPPFSPGASPPLILAFLAIGLFAVSMMGVLGWRRFQFGRFGPPPDPRGLTWRFTWDDLGSAGEVGGRRPVGPKPKLWDLWTVVMNSNDLKRPDNNRELGWDSLMPISATLISDKGTENHASAENEDDDNDTANDPATNVRTASLSATRQSITIPVPHHHHTRRREPATTKERNAPLHDDVSETERLQVAVAIAMPSRRAIHGDGNVGNETGYREKSRDESEDEHQNKDIDPLEYTFGVYECAWKHENS